MANINFWDADQKLLPSVKLPSGQTGHMFHLARGSSDTGPPGTTAVDTAYIDPRLLATDPFKNIGGMTGADFRRELALQGRQDDAAFLPYQIPSGVQAPDQNPAVGNGRSLWNALVRGFTNLATSGQSGSIRNALNDNNITKSAYEVGGAGDRVTDLAKELELIGRGDLTGQTQEQILARAPMKTEVGLPGFTMSAGRGYFPQGGYTRSVRDETDPTYVQDTGALTQAKEAVAAQDSYNRETKKERSAIDSLKSMFTNPPQTLNMNREFGDPRLQIDQDHRQLARWALSMTPEQRAAVTPEVLETVVKQTRTASRAKEIVRVFTNKANTESFLKDYQGGSAASKTYGEDGAGYGSVWDKHGLAGLSTLLAEQGLESAPSTAATMLATTIAGIATGGSGAAAMIAMGGSTAIMGSGGNFTGAFQKWAASQDIEGGIKMEDLSNADSPSFKNLITIANRDPVLFMQQMDKMTSEGDKRALAEGVVAIGLNKLGDFGMGKVKASFPSGALKEGSPLWALRGSIRRPSQLASGEVWRKSLGPKLGHAALGTSWEAVEEGLTEVLTSVAVGDDIDLKTALSSFLVGGLMGGASNFVAGRSNVDDPMAIVRTQIINNEGGIDEVAAQIARNTGMPVAKAKSAIIRAKHLMDQFDEHMSKQDPKLQRNKAFRDAEYKRYMAGAIKVDKHGFLVNHRPDQRQVALADARKAHGMLLDELRTQKLEAWTPGSVKPDPNIKATGDLIFNLNSNTPPGHDPARYK